MILQVVFFKIFWTINFGHFQSNFDQMCPVHDYVENFMLKILHFWPIRNELSTPNFCLKKSYFMFWQHLFYTIGQFWVNFRILVIFSQKWPIFGPYPSLLLVSFYTAIIHSISLYGIYFSKLVTYFLKQICFFLQVCTFFYNFKESKLTCGMATDSSKDMFFSEKIDVMMKP